MDQARIDLHARLRQIVFHQGGLLEIGDARYQTRLRPSELALLVAMTSLTLDGWDYIRGKQLFEALYGDEVNPPQTTKVIHVLICTMRKKLEETPIRIITDRKFYRLAVETPGALDAEKGDEDNEGQILHAAT